MRKKKGKGCGHLNCPKNFKKAKAYNSSVWRKCNQLPIIIIVMHDVLQNTSCFI